MFYRNITSLHNEEPHQREHDCHVLWDEQLIESSETCVVDLNDIDQTQEEHPIIQLMDQAATTLIDEPEYDFDLSVDTIDIGDISEGALVDLLPPEDDFALHDANIIEKKNIRLAEPDSDQGDPDYIPSSKSESSESVSSDNEQQNNNVEKPSNTESASQAPVATVLQNIENNTGDQSTQRGRKRKRMTSQWQCNIRKRKCSRGEQYSRTDGRIQAAKTVKRKDCKCMYKCRSKLTAEDQERIKAQYYSRSYVEKNHFITTAVKSVEKRTTKVNSRRKRTLAYYLLDSSGNEVQVCRSFFLGTLDISERRIFYTLKKVQGGKSLSDSRGKCATNVLDPKTHDSVRKHIESFPTIGPHYVRRDSKKKYLAAELNLNTMYRMYVDKCKADQENVASVSTYRKIFNYEYNLGFYRPKKDQCTKCNQFHNGSSEAKLKMKDDYDQHRAEITLARENRDNDKAESKSNSAKKCFNFDKQAILATPKLFTKPSYYKRKLATYNVTTYDLSDAKGVCNVWDETEGGRGSNEIATIIYNHINSFAPEVTEISMMSDTAGGENRNCNMAAMCSFLVTRNESIIRIDHKFFVSGHSEMESDSMHSAIQREAKFANIHVPQDWYNIMRLARKNNPYEVNTYTHDQFLDFKSLKETLGWINFKKNVKGEVVRWLAIKWLRYEKIFPGKIMYKYTLSETVEFSTIDMSGKVTRAAAKTWGRKAIPKCYGSRLPISSAKKKDLLDLCKDSIPEYHHRYYSNLSCTETEERAPVVMEDEIEGDDPDH